MRAVYTISNNILSPLGNTTGENFEQLLQNKTAFNASIPLSKTMAEAAYTPFESMLMASITRAIELSPVELTGKNTILIISTTKGNISLLENNAMNEELRKKISLPCSAKKIASTLGFTNTPLVISNACISGVAAMVTAKRLLENGSYEHAVVAGADVISTFITSGFQSFQALSDEPCRPFDAKRKGLNLGEAAATIVLTTNKNISNGILASGGSTSNDANHISGPSRTGEELALSIKKTMAAAGLKAHDIDYVSAHGTATLYNDEMEAKALALCGLQDVPMNSLKGYFGHTLGAAGLVESIIAMECMLNDTLLASAGFEQSGVSSPIYIITGTTKANIRHSLKTASGFGGCNASILFSKQ